MDALNVSLDVKVVPPTKSVDGTDFVEIDRGQTLATSNKGYGICDLIRHSECQTIYSTTLFLNRLIVVDGNWVIKTTRHI